MLSGGAQRTFGIADHGGEFGGCHRAHIRAHFAVRAAVLPQADKNDASIRFDGHHIQRGWRAGMDANATDRGRGAKRGLPASFHPSRLPKHADQRAAPESPNSLILLEGAGRLICGKQPVPHSPLAKSPFATNTLDGPRISANSRFLTKCYLSIAAKAPKTRRRNCLSDPRIAKT